MHTTTGIRGKFCAELVYFFIVFGENRKIAFKNALDACTFMPWLLGYFDLPSSRFRIEEKVHTRDVLNLSGKGLWK